MESLEKAERRTVFSPSLDIIDGEGAYVITADVPGAISDGIEISLDGDLLTVKAKVKTPDLEGLPLIYGEYEVGDFETTLRVSEGVDREKIGAELKDGVLTVTLPKAEEIKPRQIKVKAA